MFSLLKNDDFVSIWGEVVKFILLANYTHPKNKYHI